MLDEYFLLQVTRKVKHDATLSLENILFETEQRFANSRVEVRYDPDWLLNPNISILLYHEGKKLGEARQVNFHDNARTKRKGPGRPANNSSKSLQKPVELTSPVNTNSISFASILQEDSSDTSKEVKNSRR